MGNTKNNNEITDFLAKNREERGKEFIEVAYKADVQVITVRNWEQGLMSPSLNNTIKWANALGYELKLVKKCAS